MKEVMVVIPNYNGIKFIANCLHALEKQKDAPAFEVLVVDNGSTDGSRQLVEKHFKKVQMIALDKNYGFCRAVNVGIKAAKTEYVVLLNNDTEVFEDFLKHLYLGITKSHSIFSVSPMMIQLHHKDLIDDAGDCYCALGWAFSRGKDKPIAAYEQPAYVTAACGGASIYRKRVFEEIGYFDETHFAYLEDVDVGYRARLYGYENIYEPKAKVYHEGSGASGSRYNEFKVTYSSRNSIYLIRKNMPVLQRLLNLPFFMAGFFTKILFFYRKGFGRLYCQGLWEGMKLPLQDKKVSFQKKHWKNYVKLQIELWKNVVVRLRER
ncbi:MAG: glycosyltransferase family 2 protein [Lachnospiraceae bacterium]|nr:glycosyltransferase family 2 protein [Lachnospiraceae bacterium]